MKWLAVFVLFLGAVIFLWIYISKYKFFKKNGYWYEDCAFKHAALIYSILFFLVGVFGLILAISDYFI